MKITEDRFYYIKPVSSLWKKGSYIVKWSRRYSIEVDENVEHSPYISVSYDKSNAEPCEKPKSTEYEKVRPIIKQVFIDHYRLAIKNTHDLELKEGEFYLLSESKSWYRIAYFSADNKKRIAIEIDFRDGIEDAFLTLNGNAGYGSRPAFRKKAQAITQEKFIQFLNCTLQFLYDSDSYAIFFDNYLKSIYNIAAGGEEISGFVISTDKSLKKY